MLRFQGKKVLITGASSGIGKACAEGFAKEGADLILCGRDRQRLEKVAHAITSHHYVKVLPLSFDISNSQAVENALAELSDEWREIEVLVNNAGLALGYEKLYAGNLSAWDKVIDTNIKSVVYMTRFIVDGMVKRERGQVINVGSISSRTTYSGGSVYCASKFAVRALTDTLRMDLHGTPVRVTLVDPGMVKTEFFDIRLQGDQAKVDALFAGMNPLQPEDVADAIVYCATRPAHVSIHEINIMPTDQTAAHMIYRRKIDE
jgi:3-hydroxy acid dehydrogenase / malonic semialdehyde reductase